jgi:uroporphyrinogen-III decarboxylase
MELDALHDWIGSDRHTGIAGCTREVRRRTAVEIVPDGVSKRNVYRTPHGERALVVTRDESSQSLHPVDFPVKTVDDIRFMTDFYEDVSVELDRDALEQARREADAIGQNAVTQTGIGTSPLMHFVEWLAGVENGHFLLADHPEEVDALFSAMHRVLVRKAELLCEYSPADLLYLMENTSTTLISPSQYRQYCAGHVSACAALTSEAGRHLVLHMCGHLKALLPDLAQIRAQAFEAFTSPPVGNTTLLDGRRACPDKCLIGGTNAVLWTRAPADIADAIEQDLDALPHHRGIVVTSAGVMPPLCTPETIREVCERVKRYAVRMSEA